MKTILFIIVILVIGLVVPVLPRDIYSLIMQGKLEEAADSLSHLSTASVRDGNSLFYQSLLEPDAQKAAQLMEAALNASVSAEYQEEIYLRLAQYYLITDNYHELQQFIMNYRTIWEQGRYDARMKRYSIVVDQELHQYEWALRQTDRYLIEYTNDEMTQWGELDKARILLKLQKNIGAIKLLKQLSRSKSGPGVPPALYLLTIDAVKKRRTDDAVFYYNLLREGYAASIGLSSLINRLADLSGDESKDSEADALTGTFYSVQVGVFSENDNAKKQAKLFKKYGYEVDIRKRTISNVTYQVVYVGRFKSFGEAAACKKKLEAEHNEAFQVVAR